MLRMAIPKGSLEEGLFKLFQQADLPIKRSGIRDYDLTIEDPRINDAVLLRAQEVSKYVEEGEFDFGITGLDWIMETESNVQEVADLRFSKQGWSSVKIVLATDISNPISDVREIDNRSRVVTEYPRLTRRFFKKIGKGKIKIRISYGATEVKVPRLAEYLVDVTETGETLKRNNKKIIAVLLESSTKLIANQKSWQDEKKRIAIEEISMLLLSVISAQDKVLIKMNIPEIKVSELVKYIYGRTVRPPTISPVVISRDDSEDDNISDGSWKMIETVVNKSDLNSILPEIRVIGAKDIIELNVSKMIS